MTTAEVTMPAALPARTPVVYRPESAVFWLYIAALVGGIVSLLAGSGSAINATLNTQIALAPLWLAFIVFLVWVMLKFDPYRGVRGRVQGLVAAAALGGTAAVAMAIYGNDALNPVLARWIEPDTLSQWSAALTAPFVEEASKAMCAAVILVLCAAVFHRISHALLVGMFVGFGFDIIEDLIYATRQAIDDLDSDFAGAENNLIVRIATAIPAHWAYTALASVGVLLLLPTFADRASWSWPRRIGIAAVLFVCASFMHFIWDAPVPGILGKFAINIVVFLTAALLLIRDERRWVTDRITAGRTSSPLNAVDPAVLDSLPTLRARRRLRRQARRTGGRAAKKAAKRAQRDALDLIQTG